MPTFPFVSILVLALAAPAVAHISSGRTGNGFIGYPIAMYNPTCAYACRDTVTSWTLNCTDSEDMSGHDMSDMAGMDMGSSSPSPECFATNDPFLQTLAWCISTHCTDEDIATLETYWQLNVAGRQAVQPLPKDSYQRALLKVTTPPTSVLDADAVLNEVSLVDEDAYAANLGGEYGFEDMEITHERYGLTLLISGAIIPIAFSFFRLLPLPASFTSKFYAYLIDPPLFGRYRAVPVLGLAMVPTRGQGLFIAYIIIINIVLSSVGYRSVTPNSWFASVPDEIAAYIANRVGVLSFANVPLLVLYSSRNNALLWLTNWSHTTFLLVHRWVAIICMLQAALHSAMYLQSYLVLGGDAYKEESQLAYWYWGIIATLSLVLLMPLSILWLRKRLYEVFLAAHIALAVLALVGCYLHIYYRFEHQWGYETWIYVAFAIWGFDRLLARPVRLAANGVKRAHVSVIDGDYLRIDIPGLDSTGHVYLYFPTLTWRVWENHPFSVLAGAHRLATGMNAGIASEGDDLAKGSTHAQDDAGNKTGESIYRSDSPESSSAGITGAAIPATTVLVRRCSGLTALLTKHAGSPAGIPVLVESSYGEKMTILPDTSTHPSAAYPNLLCIAGGVGVTALLPMLDGAGSLLQRAGTTTMYWNTRSEALVAAVESIVHVEKKGDDEARETRWGMARVTVSVGERFNLRAVLEKEIRGAVGGTTVAVCGPPGMADEVRCIVAGLGRNGAVVRLVEESFSW
ncbi:putative ferric-chelate reductase [Cercophora scortea]|uniref:Ferric-chelate reductase n=1 Tax=Cercophora scortea TaxID=314031 RepID=A0AAE0IG70_9PEZI|nr:putative ferric-chelate reductase [Cercophora scortea]